MMVSGRLVTVCTLLLISPLAAPSQASAQDMQYAVPPAFLDGTRPDDGILRICLNGASAIADFDREIAIAIADALLLDYTVEALVDAYLDPYPLDYHFIIEGIDLFVAVSNRCDVLMGYPLPLVASVPDWLTISVPYYRTRNVLAVTDADYERLEDIPVGKPIGVGMGSAGDMRFRAYNAALPASESWSRRVTPDNGQLVEHLLDGQYEGAIIWEPALYLGTGGDPAGAGIRFAGTPFTIETIDFSIAMPTNAAYLRGLMDGAIASLRADGTIEAIAAQFKLPGGQ